MRSGRQRVGGLRCRAIEARAGTAGAILPAVTDREAQTTQPGTDPLSPRAVRDLAAPPVTAPERYQLLHELGRGAMGTVWLARDRALDREVAFKVLHDCYLSEAHQERLASEARAMARLSHPNVVTVHDVGVCDGRVFVAMERVRGEPLSQWLETPRPWPAVVQVFLGVGAGLAAAHAAGLVHRDVKPGNILLGDDGQPRLADFGVAHASRALGAPATTATATAGPIGSPAYMPPERLVGDAGGARGDQFGFCAALYEVLHGTRPFAGETAEVIVAAIHRGPPQPVRPVPAWLHAVVARGLAAEPSARFASMTELLAALRAGPRRRGRRIALAAALAVGALAAIGGAVAVGGRGRGGGAPVAAVDAAAVIVPGATAAPDAAVRVDAGAVDAGVVDAPGPAVTPARPKPASPPRDPSQGLSRDELMAAYRQQRLAWKDASERGDLKEARRIAERAVPYARRLGSAEPVGVVMVLSCRLDDARAARAAYAALPTGTPDTRYAREDLVRICRNHGMELGDLLE